MFGCACLGRGLAGDSRNDVLSVDTRHEEVDPRCHGRAASQERQGTDLVSWELVYSRQALKDAKKLKAAGLKTKAEELLEALKNDPLQNPPSFEKLIGDLAGAYSRRINIHNRLVYEVFPKEKVVRILRMWTHYECAA